MSSSSKGSKLIPVVVGLVLILFVAGFLFITQVGIPTGKGQKQVFDLETKRLKTVTVDADLPQDTLETIAINSADIKDKFKDIEETNFENSRRMREMAETLQQLNETNRLLKAQLEQQNRKVSNVESAISSQPKTLDAETIKNSVMSVLQRNLPDLLQNTPMGDMVATPSNTEYQVTEAEIDPKARTRIRSYGLPTHNAPGTDSATRQGVSARQTRSQYATPPVSPVAVPDPYAMREHQTVRNQTGAADTRELRQSSARHQKKDEEVIVDPRYTIPPDAVLNDSVTVTALIGRIPRDGDVKDPAPFKVAIGRDNLAANGFTMPGISGMIMSGIAYGDAVRQCVRTKILRATYIFEDGRILSLPRGKQRRNQVIGYLADPYTGDPCIRGRYFTNQNTQVFKRILSGMASGAANAYAETQVTTISNGQGGITRSVTGDNKKFVMGAAIANGANSVADHLARMQFDQWDQVVVKVGQRVTIHIDTQLEIDNASNLRKVRYENTNDNYGLTD